MCRMYSTAYSVQRTAFMAKRYTIHRMLYAVRCTKTAFTLIELLITIVLVSILIGAVWMVYDTAIRTFYTQWTRTGAKGEAGRMLVNISQELRQANSVTTSQQTNLIFTADTDSNGVDDTIQYTWSGNAGNPLNRVSTVTTPVVNSVSALTFSYYDANNNSTIVASQVRLVAIDVTVTDKDETFALRSRVRLRNLS